MKLSLLFSKCVGSLYFLANNFFHIILKLLKSMSILETIAMLKIYHILNMEALCQTIEILRLSYYCFCFDSQADEKAKT